MIFYLSPYGSTGDFIDGPSNHQAKVYGMLCNLINEALGYADMGKPEILVNPVEQASHGLPTLAGCSERAACNSPAHHSSIPAVATPASAGASFSIEHSSATA